MLDNILLQVRRHEGYISNNLGFGCTSFLTKQLVLARDAVRTEVGSVFGPGLRHASSDRLNGGNWALRLSHCAWHQRQ
jgi:hypothetical protein